MNAHTFSNSAFGVSSRRLSAPASTDCASCSADGNPAVAAFAAFATLSTDCGSAITVINQANFGPFGDNGSCSYDCGFREQTWWWKADYTPTKTNYLVPGVSNMNGLAAYTGAFQPVKDWVGGSMTSYGASLNGSLTLIAQIDQAIIKAGFETPEQAAELTAAFENANAQVQGNLNTADQALQNVAGYINWSQQFVGSLQSLSTARQAWITQDATNLENNLIGQIATGFTAMQQPFNTVNADLQAALNAGSGVAGSLLVIQSDSQLVSNEIANALSYAPTDQLRQFHLNLAASDWGVLTTTAISKLAT
jgi:hypothetical protein